MELLLTLIIVVLLLRAFLRKPAKDLDDTNAEPQLAPTIHFVYERKSFVMTYSENDFHKLLVTILGDQYHIFPQAHLSSFIEPKKGARQNWVYAFKYINTKSVDFLICDKVYNRPLLAIELDDITHDYDNRKQRDVNVEHMLKNADMPLLRFRGKNDISPDNVTAKLATILPGIINTA